MRRLLFAANFLFFIFIFSLPLYTFCQVFGGNPPSLKWKQINTDTARVIFPKGLDSQALRVSSIVHYLASHPVAGSQSMALGNKLYKINIVLQNQTTLANGYVGLGPYRSEFYLNPAMSNFDQGTVSWIDQLALHEYRHVQQFNNFRTGLSKLAYTLFGQDGFNLAVNGSIPDWFYEGDAVYNETVFSNQGRGRLPLFLNAYPSLWQARKKYSWMKLRNGSLKDYVPDHYYLGYLLVNYGREKYGLDFWSKVTQDAAAYKGIFYPFQKAVKKYTGVDYRTFYNDAFAYYKKLSSDLTQTLSVIASEAKQGEGLQETEAGSIKTIMPVNKRVVTNYFFPYTVSEDTLLYLKTGYNRRPAFYVKNSNGEHLLRVRDISFDEQFSYRNGKVVYSSYESDPRWRWRDYSVIKLLDISTNQQQTIRHKTRYFTPDISPSGEKIAAVQVETNGKTELHIINVADGEVISTIRSADITVFTDPKFIDDSSLVCVVRLHDGKSALAIADLTSGSIERLTAPSFNVAGYPCVNNGMVYFTASYGGNDDVFAMRLNDKKIYKISNGPLGNYFVNAAGGKITWSAFTAEGYQLRQMEEKDIQREPVSVSTTETVNERFPVSHETDVKDILLNANLQRNFPISKYNKGTRPFNFHSWRPYYEDPEFTFTLYGQNVLNTVETEIYYLFNQNDETHAAGFNFIYGALFPYLSAGTQYTFNRSRAINNTLKEWGQLDSRLGFNFPFSWASGKTYNLINFGSSYIYRNEFLKGASKNLFSAFNFSYLSHFITVGQQVQMAKQHIYPKLGYSLTFNYRHAITKYTSWQPLITGSVYLPGLLPAHSLVLTGAFQETDTLNVLFGNRFPYSRGYNEFYFARMWGIKGNYHFPVLYPDWGFGNILYLHRLRANAFYDFTRVYSPDKTKTVDQRSVGGEIYVDTNWWNQYPLTFGFRVSRLLDNDFLTRGKATVYEFIMPVSIFPR